jgi:hypothetical protein
MKKSKILIVGLIGLLMAGGLFLAGCANPCALKKGECSYSVSREGELRDVMVCSESGCKVAKDMKDFEEKPGSCDCK